jgi:hypothetical protein
VSPLLLLMAATMWACGVLGQGGERAPEPTAGSLSDDPRWRGVPRPVEGRWTPEPLLVGAGDRIGHMEDGVSVPWWRVARDMGVSINAQALWVTRGFHPSWFGPADLAEMSEAGVTPVLILYYFGDDVSQEYVTAHADDYREWVQGVMEALACEVPLLVVLEPEFNNILPSGARHVRDWQPFADLMIQATGEVRLHMPQARVGVCPGDYRAYDLWGTLGALAPYLDFLAFQELWGQTRPSHLSEDYEDVTDYALLFTSHLSTVYQKPVLLAYLGVSSYTPAGASDDWGVIKADVWRNLTSRSQAFVDAGLVGALAFALYDDPAHVGYFGAAEAYWGLLDAEGKPKEAFWAWKSLVDVLPGLRASPQGAP